MDGRIDVCRRSRDRIRRAWMDSSQACKSSGLGLSQVRTPLAAKSRSQLPVRQQPCTIFGTRLVEGYWGNEEIDMKAKEDESGKGMMQRVREGLEEEEF